jgi:uncharacterized membrane protein YqiK
VVVVVVVAVAVAVVVVFLPHVRVRVARAAGRQVRLDGDDDEGGNHGDEARQRGVALAEKVWQTGVRQRLKGRREQVDKGRGHEHAGAGMLAVEEDGFLSGAGARASGEEGEAAG